MTPTLMPAMTRRITTKLKATVRMTVFTCASFVQIA
jgi:hypothetical protein